MATGKLAELWIDISLRGAGKVELVAMRNELAATDKALARNGDLYQRQANAKLNIMSKLAARQAEYADYALDTYGSEKFRSVMSQSAHADVATQRAKNKRDLVQRDAAAQYQSSEYGSQHYMAYLRDKQGVDVKAKQADEYRRFQETTIEKGQSRAVLGLLAKRFATRDTSAGGLGGGAMGAAASLAGVAGSAAMVAAPVAAAVSAVFYGALRSAAGTTPNAANLLSKSFEMVTNEIGMTFLPVLVTVSRALQQFSETVRVIRDKFEQFQNSNPRTVSAVRWGTEASLAGVPGSAAMVRFARWLESVGKDNTNTPMLASSTARASYSSFEEGWRRVQQEAASQGSIDAQILQQQIEANNRLQMLVNNTLPANQPQPGNK